MYSPFCNFTCSVKTVSLETQVDLTRCLILSMMVKVPSASNCHQQSLYKSLTRLAWPISPVLNHPSSVNVSASSSGRLKYPLNTFGPRSQISPRGGVLDDTYPSSGWSVRQIAFRSWAIIRTRQFDLARWSQRPDTAESPEIGCCDGGHTTSLCQTVA